LWGMNNEINGVTVSNIGIYMCVDDPLNIYSTINKPSNQLVLSDKQLNIQNFNESVQRKINNTINITNVTYNNINIPSTTTTPSPTTTTPSPTTTTHSQNTITPSQTTNLRITKNKSALYENKESKIEDDDIDSPLIITLTVVSIFAFILCCIRCNPLVYEFVKRRCTKKISIAEKKELPHHVVKLNIKEKKQKKVTPLNSYNRRGPPPPQVVTPKRKVSLGFNTMGNDQDWYKKTFQNELSQFKDMEPPPSAPKPPTPKLPIPTLKADLIDGHVHANQLINNKMDNIINNIENTKKEMSLDKKYKSPSMNIREVGKVKQRVNSIEKKGRKPDFRNVRLNSWTNEGKKFSRDIN
ncbi:hypothetical protein OAA99_02620, partial [Omnitrophica bacterium]|nr:hypothetical protein [Candidatus Omnitrophota bacterium]